MTYPGRILLATDAVGGVWQYGLELAGGLGRLGIETVLAVCGPSPSSRQRAAAAAVGIRIIDTGLPLDWLAPDPASVRQARKGLAGLARRERVDLVQLNGAALAAGAEFDMPCVVVQHSCLATWWEAVHGTEPPADFRWRIRLAAEGLAAADAIVAPTAAFAEAVRRNYGLTRSPIGVHNGRAMGAEGDGASHDYIFTAGRLWDAGKNVATLDAAAARLPVPFHAAGPCRSPSGETVRLGALHPLGELDEAGMSRWLRCRPIFASAALYEPFGLAVLEAAAAGCPLILSDIPTFRELWDGAALFVPARDAAGFAEAIEGVIGDELQRGWLGEAARERAASYRPERMVARMAEIYARLVDEREMCAQSLGMAAAL